MNEDINKWLMEGRQSKADDRIKAIAAGLGGGDFEKIKGILKWMNGNLVRCRDEKQVLEIFATRDAAEVVKSGFSTGCHDDALVFTVLCRTAGIPAKYIGGINKLTPRDNGHCVTQAYASGDWVLVDQSKSVVYLTPSKSHFHHGYFIVGTGLDSWDIGISSFKTWREKSDRITTLVSEINTRYSSDFTG